MASWLVPSARADVLYRVNVGLSEYGLEWDCECRGWAYHQPKPCRHIKMAREALLEGRRGTWQEPLMIGVTSKKEVL